MHWVHVHPQCGEKMAKFTGESFKCIPRQKVHPRGKARVQLIWAVGEVI